MSSERIVERRRGAGSGLALVVSGPSGAGKNTAINALLTRDPRLAYSVSHTTRRPRPGESEGVDYHFVSGDAFDALADAGEFLEHVTYLGDRYGTSRAEIARLAALGRDIVLNIDVQGARALRARTVPGVALAFVFFAPPSLADLEARLRARGSEGEAERANRLRVAREELDAIKIFDYLVVNDELDQVVRELEAIVAAERLRVRTSG
ncbi:MAG: guanylate kinase [Candidatus Bipolaricaulota bacterium]